MDDKRNSLLTIGLVCAVLLVLGVADLWNSDRVYSEAENRVPCLFLGESFHGRIRGCV